MSAGAPGEIVAERWALERRLDAGGASAVWLARDRRSGTRVALKLATSDVPPPAWPVHPRLVRVLATGRDASRVYVAMALAPGRTLAALLADDPPSPVRARVILSGIEEGLRALRAAGLGHGDLRPPNIMVGPAGEVTLLDPEDPASLAPSDDDRAVAAIRRALGVAR